MIGGTPLSPPALGLGGAAPPPAPPLPPLPEQLVAATDIGVGRTSKSELMFTGGVGGF